MGSTSQIKEISGAGNEMMAQSMDMGKQMGLDKAKKREELNRNERARLAQEGYNKRARLSRAAAAQRAGNTGAKSEKLTAAERTKVLQNKENYTVVEGMLEAFDDDFANNEGLGFIESAIQTGMTDEPNLTKWGLETWDELTKGKSQEEAVDMKRKLEREQQWWGMYERLSKIPERARMFGATLTANEMNSWNQADIKPGMTAEQIRSNLTIRKGLARKWFNEVSDYYRELGFNPGALDQLEKGMGPRGEERSMGDIVSKGYDEANDGTMDLGPGIIDDAAVPASAKAPEGVEQAEWDSYSKSDRAEIEDYIATHGELPK